MSRKTHSKNKKKLLFQKLRTVNGYDFNLWRMDNANKLVCYPSYGDQNSEYGWNIHHINENHLDNRISNLLAVHHDTHYDFHN
jgi:hypothetical protein